MLLPRFRELHRAALSRQWKGILAVGSFIALNIVLNNLSLVSNNYSHPPCDWRVKNTCEISRTQYNFLMACYTSNLQPANKLIIV